MGNTKSNKIKVIVKKCSKYDGKRISGILSDSFRILGLESRLNNIKTVLLKPNLIISKEPHLAATTHPVIIDAVCRSLKKLNKNLKIFIGESSGSVLFDGTKAAFKVCGVEKVAKKWKAKMIYFESSKRKKVAIKKKGTFKEFCLPKEIFECDYMINLPKLKTHTFTKYTGAVKNLFGLLSTDQKMGFHKKFYKQKDFVKNLIDLHRARKPDLNIMDAIVGMEGNGPTSGNPRKFSYLFISEDALALDSIASKSIGFKTKYNPLINYAKKNKILKKVELVGDKILKIKFKKPFGLRSFMPELFGSRLQLFFVPSVSFDSSKCKKCYICIKACPASALTLNSECQKKPNINYKKCLKCYCCHELCPNEAVNIKDPSLKKILNIVLRRK